MSGFVSTISLLVLACAVSYGVVRLILGDPQDSMVHCNDNIQGFDFEDTPIYWRIHEGTCVGSDPNYEKVRIVVESLLLKMKKNGEEWPAAVCEYGTVASSGYVWSYGTDYYDIEELDCLEPLRELQREKEENINVAEYLGGVLKEKKQDIFGAVLNNFL